MTDLERMAREHLSEHYRSNGHRRPARAILDPGSDQPGTKLQVQALMTALTKAPPGWKLVPVEPDDKQIHDGTLFRARGHGVRGVYKAMLAAAPEYKEGE